eukprot:7391432-Prymnesium_polylepis.2
MVERCSGAKLLAEGRCSPRSPASRLWWPVPVKINLRAGGVLRDPNVFIVVSLAALAHGRIPDHAKPARSRCP